MKIAIIDTGIIKEACDTYEVKHFSLSKEGLINAYYPPMDKHGTDCFKEIIANSGNKELQVIDLNILKEGETLEVGNIVRAIETAIEERADIINISLGLMSFSQELYEACEKAVYHNIVIVSAASHTNTISFPADFNNVVCVKVDQSQTEGIHLIDDSTVSMNMRDFIIIEGDNQFDFSSSSLACARFSGYLCNELGDNPLSDKYKILSHKYKLNLCSAGKTDKSVALRENYLQKVLQNNRAAIVVFPADMLNKFDQKFFNNNVIAYYDHKKCGFYSFNDNKLIDNFDLILIINTSYNDLEVPEEIQKKYKDYNVICIGNFLNIDGNKHLQKYEVYKSSELSVLDRPVIAVAGLCSGLNKWDIQLSLLKRLKEDGLEVGTVTNNPLGLLYNMNVFSFPGELKFPNIVYSINRFMCLYEISMDIDAWLINIGGAVGQVNSLNTYNFGKLVDAYLSAANIDIVVMCINPSIDVKFLKLQMAYLYKHGVEKIFLVLSHNDINAATMDYKDGLQTYYIDEKKYSAALDYLKQNVEETVLALSDVADGKLYDNIINILA
ncbi:S8 family serine peptidase [Luxibacter massiliensis]|uniref:S8 family serine peptidase n=1 Tax=Luxibacter massiliensis TaxID=2219695 RepID=UPI000F06006A|nr:S8 family serine peptidase [Luxibacter massiliensis]